VYRVDTRIIIGSDHGGLALKTLLVSYLSQEGYEVSDVGTDTDESCDYPDFAFMVAKKVSDGVYARGIIICTTGIGVSMCANKAKGVRAALCTSVDQAIMSRKHNDANVLCLGAKYTTPNEAPEICDVWLTTDFEGGRHQRRVDKIDNIR